MHTQHLVGRGKRQIKVGANMMVLTFTIQGGSNNVLYDVFANSILDFSSDTNKSMG